MIDTDESVLFPSQLINTVSDVLDFVDFINERPVKSFTKGSSPGGPFGSDHLKVQSRTPFQISYQ